MSWVEELAPDDEVEVEVIYPKFYVDHNMATMKKYSAAAAYYCRAAATIGQEKIRFKLPGVTVIQAQCIENAMKAYGVEMTHKYINGVRYFYADVSKLKKFWKKLEKNKWRSRKLHLLKFFLLKKHEWQAEEIIFIIN